MKKTFLALILCFSLLNVIAQQADTISIFFDIDKSVVDNNNAKPLDKLIADKNVISISIYGYTDFLGSTAYNQQLSEKRSANVRDFLINKGINEKNIVISKGEGIFPNSTEKNRQDLSDKGIQAHRIVKVVYITKSQIITTKEEQSKENTTNNNRLSEEKFVVNNTIVLENVIFYDGSFRFLPNSYPVLEELLEIMQQYPTLKIEIQGHICCGNDSNDGYKLSLSRAKAVHNYLFENGINPARMAYKGFGNTRKIFPHEQNEYERSKNRRVEILILEI